MNPAPATDSPWFWMAAFAFMGLVWLVAFGPKYAQRQELIERRYEARLEIARRHTAGERLGEPAGRDAAAPEPADEDTAQPAAGELPPHGLLIPLEPLVFVLAGVLEFAVWRLLAGGALGVAASPAPPAPAPGQMEPAAHTAARKEPA